MPEKRIEGVEVNATGHKKMERKYTLSDVQVVLRRGHWNDWGEMIHWLETEGEKDNELTAGETIAMTLDLRGVQQSGEQFTNDPQRVYQLMQQHKGGVREMEAPPRPAHEEREEREEAERRREAEAREDAERRREAEMRSEAERRREVEAREEAARREEEVPREEGLWSERGILRRGGYIWKD